MSAPDGAPATSAELAAAIAAHMPALTALRSADAAMANAAVNQSAITASAASTPPAPGPVVVVSAGPSLRRDDPAPQLRAGRDRITVVAVDGALPYCLRNDLVPDYVVSLDPHGTRIVRWYGDPTLRIAPNDDYFRRQEMDPTLGRGEVERNAELIDMVDRYGPQIVALLSTSVHPSVAARCAAAGMTRMWWNPLLDDPAAPDSMTRALRRQNGLPAFVTGGNVGAAAWVLAHQALGARRVALVGMDLGYPPGTPYEETQYYPELHAIFGDDIADAMTDVPNPVTGETWFADPAYAWYRRTFLDLAARASCVTLNCTTGGTLHAPPLVSMSLDEALALDAQTAEAG